MHVEQLFTIATAHGIDLSNVGGSVTELGRRTTRRRLKRSDERYREGDSVKGHGTRVSRRAAWSHAELAMAADGVPRLPWLAAQLTIAGDASGYWELWQALLREAARAGRRERWPPTVVGEAGLPVFYRERLASLALDEELHGRYFRAVPHLRAACCGVRPEVWNRHLEGPYTQLRARYETWVSTARAMIQRWICDDAPAAA